MARGSAPHVRHATSARRASSETSRSPSWPPRQSPCSPTALWRRSPYPTRKVSAHEHVARHITSGPEAPTRAALGLLVAGAGIEEGHDVDIFLAGDAVQLIRGAVLDSLSGLGTGSLRESFDAVVAGGGRFYLSGMSSKARGVTDADLEGKPAEFAMPKRLVQLAFEADRTFTY